MRGTDSQLSRAPEGIGVLVASKRRAPVSARHANEHAVVGEGVRLAQHVLLALGAFRLREESKAKGGDGKTIFFRWGVHCGICITTGVADASLTSVAMLLQVLAKLRASAVWVSCRLHKRRGVRIVGTVMHKIFDEYFDDNNGNAALT